MQDRTGRRTNSASTQPAAETYAQEMPERSQEVAYRMWQTYSQASACITSCLIHLRGGESGNPALSSSSPRLHSCITLCCTQQNAAAQQVIVFCLSFFFLEHYFPTGKLVTGLHVADASAMRSPVTSLLIPLKKKIIFLLTVEGSGTHLPNIVKDAKCYCWLVCYISLTPSWLGHHCKILLSSWSIGVCIIGIAMLLPWLEVI